MIMKQLILILYLLIIFILISCSCFRQSVAGDKQSFTAGNLELTMVFVPAKRFYTDEEDKNTNLVKKGFWIGETEVTYELWLAVCAWAAAERGYNFANPGTKGYMGEGSTQQPVTTLNWRDALVWCNAFTEWINAQTGSHLRCVYKFHGEPIRDARGNNYMQYDTVVPDKKANGFRLPTGNEWELAARYREDKNMDGDILDADEYYPGNFASGATAPWTDDVATGLVAVYHTTGTAEVKSKKPNALGIYDMCGNVSEWCFDWFPGSKDSSRLVHGGSWLAPADVQQLSYILHHDPYTEYFLIGFRIVRNE